ncbi:PREDICTED: beta-hexosaminidase subunit beta-like [Rhagoletis zephyria]|uniref:beta-hexosaminidase subunit beta-like n=1 Tax=Rhagoletis zephyria TaxID=28612 RepID=UPI0008119C83|nr:PREDICTED: beta-hexosaminidase subunit beta-like [Rhagoletis zephyria]
MRSLIFSILLAILCCELQFSNADGGYRSYGPEFKATAGKVWPKPHQQVESSTYYAVNATDFKFVAVNNNCALLEAAFTRYANIIRAAAEGYIRAPATATVGVIRKFLVNLTQPCENLPHLDMDESYYVRGDGVVKANSIWGILRGLETLSQLLVPMPSGLLLTRSTEIYDQPRFKYRGVMLDSARHFVSKKKILQLIDGMAYNKLNVFHWHMTDDSAFPYNSSVFPELSAKGAYRPELTYSKANVKEVVEYARVRGVRVVAEFDAPAHTASWGASHPEIMTKCAGEYAGQLGPLDPTNEGTFNFLYKLFREIKTLFPDKYLHLGIDEVDSACWETNADIQAYLKAHGLDDGDLSYLYLERFSANISAMGWKQMVWQEAMTENFYMEWPAGTVAQIWFDYKNTMAALTKKGYDVIMSDGWYLYVLDTGADWEKFYNIEPTDFKGSKAQKAHVIGGEACLWSEWINEYNVLPTTFPRVSATAERLWSSQNVRDVEEARLRLEEHNCRMIWRGIEARPANGFGIC